MNRTPRATPLWTGPLVLLWTALLTGCLDLDAKKPECFQDDPCDNGGACVAGRCESPTGRVVRVEAGGCLGAEDGACAALWQGGLLCLVVADDAHRVATALVGPSAELTLALEAGVSRVQATLYVLEPDALCSDALAPTCATEDGCRGLWQIEPFTADAGPLTLDFAQPACLPTFAGAPAETCDGGDQDCDGQVDETFDLDLPCEVGVGACQVAGARQCGDDGEAACVGTPGTPMDEVAADGLDNDCDGTTDEVEGACMVGESMPCGVELGACREGTQTCDQQGVFGPCLDTDGAMVRLPDAVAESCNTEDDDCDGEVDEDLALAPDGPPLGAACPGGVGACAGNGVVVCEAGVPVCDLSGLSAPGVETCNTVDDDCDGMTDEALGLGEPCQVGVGACQAEGVRICGGNQVVCSATEGVAGVERCTGGQDEDCDGATDEDFADLGVACERGEGACLARGRRVCADDGISLVCDAQPAPPGVEACNDLDDDCDGSTDEDFDRARDPNHCGVCNRVCRLPAAQAGCAEGQCTVSACQEGFEDQDLLVANGCECQPAALDLPDPAFIDLDCDGVDGDAESAIFVAGQLGSDQADGSFDAPYASLRRGVEEAARRGGGRVLIRADVFALAETLVVPAGVHLHGGYLYDPAGPFWTRVGPEQQATVITGVPVVLRYVNLDRPTVLDGLQVRAIGAPAGGSSVAVLAENVSDFLTLHHVTLQAGAGGAGVPGRPGPIVADQAGNGRSGGDGDNPGCSGCGGLAGENPECPDGTAGGQGGRSIEVAAQQGGQPGQGDQPGAPGAGAAVGDGEAGGNGGRGAVGEAGVAGDIAGRFVGAWIPTIAGHGQPGRPGSGGGGAGAGALEPFAQLGGGGGGGGAGGCGGPGGFGGGGGGGSFALLVNGGRVVVITSRLLAGPGGRGGDGGAGSEGGAGAAGGLGGSPAAGCPGCGSGGQGGPGGGGGCGGAGGGGGGGPSAAVLAVGGARVRFLAADGAPVGDLAAAVAQSLVPGVAGEGGLGGRSAVCPQVAGNDAASGLMAPALCCAVNAEGLCDLRPCGVAE